MKNKGIRHKWINWNITVIGSELDFSDGQSGILKLTYGKAAWSTIPINIAIALKASNP